MWSRELLLLCGVWLPLVSIEQLLISSELHVQRFVRAITNTLLKIYISFPTGESLNTVINGFEHKWRFPQCVGAIDGCQVPISAPLMNHTIEKDGTR